MTTRELLLTTWNWNPFWIAVCVLGLLAYGWIFGWKLQAKSVYFFLGLILLFLSLASPIDFLARGYLFSAHMLQHLLLVLIVPPLLLLGLPDPGNKFRLPEGIAPWVKHPLIGWLSGVGAMWFWHIPAVCDAATSIEAVHTLQTFSLLMMGTLFWRLIVGPRMEERLSPMAGIPYLVSACVACSLLGIWITFTAVSVCPVFMNPMDRMEILPMIRDSWGLTPAADQQIGGLLMWVPACLVYLGAVLVLLVRFYRHPAKTEKKHAS